MIKDWLALIAIFGIVAVFMVFLWLIMEGLL